MSVSKERLWPTFAEPPLRGRVAVVTGGAKGLGSAMSEILACDGADVLLNVTTRTLSALADAEQQHRRILEPILAGDAELVQVRLVGHIAEAAERARAGLAGRPVGAPGQR